MGRRRHRRPAARKADRDSSSRPPKPSPHRPRPGADEREQALTNMQRLPPEVNIAILEYGARTPNGHMVVNDITYNRDQSTLKSTNIPAFVKSLKSQYGSLVPAGEVQKAIGRTNEIICQVPSQVHRFRDVNQARRYFRHYWLKNVRDITHIRRIHFLVSVKAAGMDFGNAMNALLYVLSFCPELKRVTIQLRVSPKIVRWELKEIAKDWLKIMLMPWMPCCVLVVAPGSGYDAANVRTQSHPVAVAAEEIEDWDVAVEDWPNLLAKEFFVGEDKVRRVAVSLPGSVE